MSKASSSPTSRSTIAVAVSFSLLVAVTVLPTGAALFMKKNDGARRPRRKTLVLRQTSRSRHASDAIRRSGALAWIAGLTIVPVDGRLFLLFPSLNYLPPVKRAAIDGFISFPSGASADMIRKEFAEIVVKRLDPYMKGEKEPALLNYYLYSGEWGGNIGVRPKVQSKHGRA